MWQHDADQYHNMSLCNNNILVPAHLFCHASTDHDIMTTRGPEMNIVILGLDNLIFYSNVQVQ